MKRMIDIRAQIESYKESKEFSKFIANINLSTSEEIPIINKTFRDAFQLLKLIIHRNIVLRYYLKEIYIPEYLQHNDMNSTENSVVSILEQLQNSLKDHVLGRNPFRFKQHKNGIFGCRKPPFFVWKYDENKDDIHKLLVGKEVILTADIRRGINKNAIKLKKIGIRFKLSDRAKQNRFDDLLQDSQIKMKHLGNSYYRCDDKFYSIATKEILIIDYYFNKDCHEIITIDPNAVYQDLANNGPALSPYAVWSIQITVNDDVNFDEYADEEIDLELEGEAEYYELGKFDDPEKLCSENMGEYYKEDDSVTEVKFVNFTRREQLREEIHFDRIARSKNRRRRTVDTNYLTEAHDKNLIATNSGCSNVKSSLVNTFFNVIGDGLAMLKYWKPDNYISHWFVDYNNDNVNAEKQYAVKTNHQMYIKELPNEFDHQNTPNVDSFSNAALLCTNANLLLLDSLIRWKNGTKYTQQRSTVSNDLIDVEHAHNLAYRGYLHKDN